MDHGEEHRQNVKASTSDPHHKRVSFMPLIKVVNLDHESGSRSDSDTRPIGIGHDSDALVSSTSNPSYGDATHVTAQSLPTLRVQDDFPVSNADTQPLCDNDSLDLDSEVLCSLEEPVAESPESTSQHSEITDEGLLPLSPVLVPPMEEPLRSTSSLQAPPIQVMEKHRGVSDSDSIPDSIFSRPSSPSTTMGWSAASNDSLFSIRIGNHSLSRDHAHRMDVDLCNPQESPESRDFFMSRDMNTFGNSAEFPDPREPCNSFDSYQPRENFKANDPTIPADEVSLRQAASQMSQGEEPLDPGETSRMQYQPLNQVETSSKQSSDSSSPTLDSDKSRTKTQSSTRQKKKFLCLPCHCPNLCQSPCGGERLCKCFSWPSCTCFSCKKCCWCCSTGSDQSCKWFTWPSCPTGCSIWKWFRPCSTCKWFTCPSCTGNCLSWKGCCR